MCARVCGALIHIQPLPVPQALWVGFAFNFFAFVVYLCISLITAPSNKKAQMINALSTAIVASSAREYCYIFVF